MPACWVPQLAILAPSPTSLMRRSTSWRSWEADSSIWQPKDAILLLRHSFAIPMLLYTLKTSPCFLSPNLKLYDDRLRSIVSTITNIHFAPNNPAWTQASLPVKFGGLGIWSAVQLVSSAFLASAAGSSDLAHHILPSHLQNVPLPNVANAAALWSQDHDHPPPVGTASHCQKTWDAHKVSATADSLLESASNATSIARRLAASTNESGTWRNALPISSLGIRMDNNTIKVAVGLKLGSPLCRPHTCHYCGAAVDHLATNGLSCRWSEGRHRCHAAINDILHRALYSAKVPSRLEPSGLYRSNGEMSGWNQHSPLEKGKLLVWDATCPILMYPPTLPLLPVKLVLWRPKRKRGSAANIAIWSPATLLCQWPLRPQVPLGLGPPSSCGSWATVSDRSLERSNHHLPPPASLSCHPERQCCICLGYHHSVHQPFCRP